MIIKSAFSLYSAHNIQNKNHLTPLEYSKHSLESDVYGVGNTQNTQASSDVELVQKTCQYLLSDLSLKLSHKELAYKMATNHNKLAQASKNVLGMGVFHWLAGERMKEAKRLCITTDLSIQEIGCQVGYSNPNSFSNTFREYFNISPMQCRKNDGK